MAIDWVQAGILGFAAAGNLLAVANIVSKNSKAMGAQTTATTNLSQTVENVRNDLKQLYDGRFDHEMRITERETACFMNHPNMVNHQRSNIIDRRAHSGASS